MVRRAVFEPAARDDANVLADIAEPELRRIEEVRAEIRQNARTLVPPLGLAHQPRRPVSVEHAAVIERTERSSRDGLAHPHEMRLETVVVPDIADGAVFSCRDLELPDRLFIRRPSPLLHQ